MRADCQFYIRRKKTIATQTHDFYSRRKNKFRLQTSEEKRIYGKGPRRPTKTESKPNGKGSVDVVIKGKREKQKHTSSKKKVSHCTQEKEEKGFKKNTKDLGVRRSRKREKRKKRARHSYYWAAKKREGVVNISRDS